MDVYASNNVPLVDKEGTNIRREKEAPEMSFTEEDSDASSVIVKTVKRKPNHSKDYKHCYNWLLNREL